MKIPKKVREVLKAANLAWVGTCADGVPNVNIVHFFKISDEDIILLADNFFNKTRRNMEQNPNVALTVKSPEASLAYELKGSIQICTEGEHFEEMKEWVHAEEEDMPTKAAVLMEVEKIFDSSPGENAGEEVPPDTEKN